MRHRRNPAELLLLNPADDVPLVDESLRVSRTSADLLYVPFSRAARDAQWDMQFDQTPEDEQPWEIINDLAANVVDQAFDDLPLVDWVEWAQALVVSAGPGYDSDWPKAQAEAQQGGSTRRDFPRLRAIASRSLARLWTWDMDQPRRNPAAPRHNPILLRSDAEALRYGTMVADAYLAAPAFDEDEAWRWQVMIKHIEKLFERIQRGKQGVKVVFVAGQPYADDRELQAGVDATGILYVSTEFNTHLIFTPVQNLKFRAVHDYMTHIARDLTFGLRGEIAAYNIHARMAPPAALPALFTEVLGQAAVFITKGFFPEQKIALLPFDYYNVGIELESSRRRRNPSPLPEGFTTRFGINVPDDYVAPPLPESRRVLRDLQSDDIVTVGRTQWVISRSAGDSQAYAHKYPSKRTKLYVIEGTGPNTPDTVIVYEVGGSGQRISEDVAMGPLRKGARQNPRRQNPVESIEVEGAQREPYLEAIWSMYVASYGKIGLIVNRPEELLDEYDVWEVSVDETGAPCAFCLYKRTPFGLKVGLSGSDGSPEGRATARASFATKYQRPGVYGEVSHRPAELARDAGVPVVCANIAAVVLRKVVEVVDDVHYIRNLTNVGPVKKMLVGLPIGVTTTDIQQPVCPAVRMNPPPRATPDDIADLDAHYASILGF